jgi:subtilisin family serine protease
MVGARPGGVPTGVAPGATVLVAKAMDRAGKGDASDILAAAQWMTDPDGDPATADQPHVVNNSWGMAVSDPWFRGMVQHWIALGIVPVFSAGNTGPGPGTIASPADYPESLAVGAVSDDGRVAPFSSRGPVTWVDHDAAGPRPPVLVPKPDLVAPGVDVVSAVPGGYATYSGTSMAAPHVSGAVALIRQAAPGLSPEAVMDVMRRSASDRGPAGPDPDYGAGALDIPAALALAGAAPAPAASPAGQAPSTTAPTAGASRRTPTLAQMRRARRIAVVAGQRVRRLEARLTPGKAPRRVAHSTRPVRLRASDMLQTRRIALGAIRRADALRARLAGRPAPRTAPLASRTRVRLTPADMRVTTRLARTALARATRLQAHPRLRA